MRAILQEKDIDPHGIMMTITVFMIGALLLFVGVSAHQEKVVQEAPRVNNALDLGPAYDFKVMKTLSSKSLLVEKDGKTLECVTPTVSAFEHGDPIYCSNGTTIQHSQHRERETVQ